MRLGAFLVVCLVLLGAALMLQHPPVRHKPSKDEAVRQRLRRLKLMWLTSQLP